MTSPSTAPDLISKPMPPSSVVFVIGSDTRLCRTIDVLCDDTGCRTETATSISVLLGQRRTFTPCCVVLDVPNSGPDDLLVRPWPIDMPVICIIDAGDVVRSVRAMKAGAVDVLTKPVDRAPLLDAIRLALKRSKERLGQGIELEELRGRYALLSRREREVMALVVAGLMNKQVGGELGISEITVKAHRGSVMRKMRAHSLANLVVMAARLQPGGGGARSSWSLGASSSAQGFLRHAEELQWSEARC